jgi:hypothetical protein
VAGKGKDWTTGNEVWDQLEIAMEAFWQGTWGWGRGQLWRTVEKGKERMAEKVKESKDKEWKKDRVGKGVRDNNKFLYRPRKEEDEEGQIWKLNESKEEGKWREGNL